MRRSFGVFVLTALATFGCGGCNFSNAPPCSYTVPPGVIPTNNNAVYVANTGSSSISAFSIGGNGELFAPVCGSPFPMSAPPTALGGGNTSSDIFELIVLSAPQKTISLFKVDFVFGDITGPVATVTTPYTPVAVDAWQDFFYVANAEGSVSAYEVSGDGAVVTQLGGSPFPAGSGPVAIAAALPGLLYVANGQSNNVSGYVLNPNTGVPTPAPGSPFLAGTAPSSVEVAPPAYPNPSGGATLVIVTNEGSNNVSVYSVGGTGSLTPVPGAPFAAGAAPSSSATGNYLPLKYVYVANSQSNDISGYSINDATGALAPLEGSPFPAGLGPLSVAVGGPSLLYAANNGSNSLSVYSVDLSGGALTPVSGSPFALGQSPAAVLYFQVPQ